MQKGYLDVFDWGNAETYESVEKFTHKYMRRFLDLPDATAPKGQVERYLQAQSKRKVKGLSAAIKILAMKRVARGSGRLTDVVLDAFRYCDCERTGRLGRAAVVDGFLAMGVDLEDSVADDLMRVSVSCYP